MFPGRASWLSIGMCIVLAVTVDAQKGGKNKAVDLPGTATFRCNGPTAAGHQDADGNPDGTACGPFAPAEPDAITGDARPFIGVGTTVGGSGAFLRFDGEFDLIVRSTDGRIVFLNFESVIRPSAGKKDFDFADVTSFNLNTNVIIPGTEEVASGGILAIPVGETWPTRIKANWNDTYGRFFTIRFNPTAYAGSTHASVRRDGDRTWTIFATNGDIARLVGPNDTKKRDGLLDEGWYVMPFEITFTLP